MAESVRVQMSLKTKKELEHLAKTYNCMYNNKPSISKLLEKIGQAEFTIKPTELNYKDYNLPLLLLTMTSPFNLNGIVAKVTRKIAKHQGNIFKIEAHQKKENLGLLKIYLSLENDKSDLSILLNEIHSIKFGEIKNINEPYQLIGAYTLLVNSKRIPEYRGTTEEIIEDLMDKRIIIDISCSFGIEIKARNKGGTLAFITEEIANRKILISSVGLKYNQQKKEDIISLFLEVKIDKYNDIFREITKIQEVINFFESKIGKNGILELQRLGIEYLNTP